MTRQDSFARRVTSFVILRLIRLRSWRLRFPVRKPMNFAVNSNGGSLTVIELKCRGLMMVFGCFGMGMRPMFISLTSKRTSLASQFRKLPMCGCVQPSTAPCKRRFWNLLREEIERCVGLVLIMGDFNCILASSERMGGSSSLHQDSAVFQGIVDDLALIDIGFLGQATTWSRGDDSDWFVTKRLLDKVLINLEVCLRWPNAHVRHLLKFGTDHTPIFLSLDPSQPQNRHRRTFCF
ncbi:hypothetical protein V2J09_005530 [Rumex salicifolius]